MSENKPKIAMVHYTCPPVVGGVEAVMAAHAQLFAARGYEVTMLVGRGPKPSRKSLPPGVEVIIEPLIDSKSQRINAVNSELEQGKVTQRFTNLANAIYERLLELLAPYSICIVHNAHTLHKNLALSAALVRFGKAMDENSLPAHIQTKQIIAWCHDLAWSNPLYHPILHEGYPWDLLKTIAPGVNYVTISQTRQAEFLKVFNLEDNPVTIVPNGVSLQDFLKIGDETLQMLKTTGIEQALLEGAVLVLLPTRVTRRKNIELAIKVASVFKQTRRRFRLIITGPPGPHNIHSDAYVQELFALRKSHWVEDEVVFLMESWQDEAAMPRPVSDAMVADLYRYCDALFFPSAQEGFGIPILEAGMARLPLFCSDIPPHQEIAGKDAYYFGLDAEPEAIALMMTDKLLTDQTYRLRRKVLQNYIWDSIFEKKIKPLIGA